MIVILVFLIMSAKIDFSLHSLWSTIHRHPVHWFCDTVCLAMKYRDILTNICVFFPVYSDVKRKCNINCIFLYIENRFFHLKKNSLFCNETTTTEDFSLCSALGCITNFVSLNHSSYLCFSIARLICLYYYFQKIV